MGDPSLSLGDLGDPTWIPLLPVLLLLILTREIFWRCSALCSPFGRFGVIYSQNPFPVGSARCVGPCRSSVSECRVLKLTSWNHDWLQFLEF